MTLVEHARRELELCGQTAEDPAYAQSIVAAVAAFASYGHSGGSAFFAVDQLTRLLRFEALSPLTCDPDEWCDVAEQAGRTLWQSRRNPQAFSTDGGSSYYLLEERDRLACSNEDAPRHHSVSTQSGLEKRVGAGLAHLNEAMVADRKAGRAKEIPEHGLAAGVRWQVDALREGEMDSDGGYICHCGQVFARTAEQGGLKAAFKTLIAHQEDPSAVSGAAATHPPIADGALVLGEGGGGGGGG